MDFSLRCNSLKCRTQLQDRAVVTTCSHIFCVPCSETLGLASPNGARVCPACETQLANPDDAVVTQLNPTEDYKTSVLSGLSPSIIMECAGRGLSFYSYQTTQEIVYQEFLARSLTDKYSALSTHMDKIIHDANSEILGLRDKLSAMHVEQKSLEQKNHDLASAFREKAKGQQQLQKLYQSLKQQQLAAGMELAAEHDAEHFLQAAGTRQRHGNNGRSDGHVHNRAGSTGSGHDGGRSRAIHDYATHIQGSRHGLQSSRSAPIPMTPSGTRARLPLYGTAGAAMAKPPVGGHGSPYRSALNDIDPNVYGGSNSAGYGMSAGVKVGRQQGGPLGRSGLAGPGGFGRLGLR
ncbi:hypothetical protein B0A50_00514 [Salinomyces thailandicus]|uniref:RING-type domain-containing protein n=1 Tax=Salinomyces thailandicus TaxID=706561 RepID=A0A4U0UDU2_9PEZI|nr:hypothetical protein B0A50_00514 [Salinomyces thailandica]